MLRGHTVDNDRLIVLGAGAKRVLFIVLLFVIILSVYLVVTAIITVETTGTLEVSATQKATISVSRTNSQAKIIGEPGKAQVRLKPGTYQVVANTSNGFEAAKVISINKKQSVKFSLNPTTSPKLPSLNSVSFFGMSALVNVGVTSGQIDMLKNDFFHFKTSAGTVSIDTQSAQTLPHVLGDPFVNTFNVNIDSQTYNGKITYSDPQSIQLQLYNPHNGHLVYDSFNDTQRNER